eukprot:4468145-Prymnesium_polylepis.1
MRARSSRLFARWAPWTARPSSASLRLRSDQPHGPGHPGVPPDPHRPTKRAHSSRGAKPANDMMHMDWNQEPTCGNPSTSRASV